ncbi:MAG: hypothetical protein ACE5FQ_13055 [Thiogranum sp.]
MRSLYPAIQPYVRHSVDADPPHRLRVEECGNPNGIPVLFLHGGPGGGCQPSHRRFFNADLYRIILFDQRGCGCSAPHAELRISHPARFCCRRNACAGSPGAIVHVRYDVVCPLEQAHALHQAWPESRLAIVPGAGHSLGDPAIVDAPIRATDGFAERLA